MNNLLNKNYRKIKVKVTTIDSRNNWGILSILQRVFVTMFKIHMKNFKLIVFVVFDKVK
jgi:hypothetical protein